MSGCRDLRALRIRHFTAQGVVKGVQKGWGYTSGGLWQRGPAAGAKGLCGALRVTSPAVSSPQSCPVQTMDPEVSLLLQCPPGGLPEKQVQAELSPDYDRRPLPGGDKAIAAIWESRLQAQPWLFDAPKFRLHSAILAPTGSQGPQLLLRLGLTSYRDFLGTNWASSAAWLRQQGATDWGDKQAYLADPLGVGATLATADNFLVFLRRSRQVAEAPGLVDVPGGHAEPQVNVPLHTLSQPRLLGIARNETSAGRASAEFYVQCSLTSEQVRKHYVSGGAEAHESTGIIFVETQSVRRLQETEMWAELCPSAKGAIFLYNQVQEVPPESP
ncbi:uridine diphosphate glucose pyrophosphatase NUDT22 isoform X2 [Neofelis nebulosa]|uniref:uridine diphosphate glucose pyrophosphatase NUDT22 isoform X2 n=1 Tax=Neofelis nebulosa TaxID=61452 RepID=UPI002729A962|nr:uridine diphosphate glucose pyrophosphatase NUDT22 isoform X2 [Neofelis nebulosa]